jgi:hypothetical protein
VTSVAPRTFLEPTSAMSTSSREPISSPVPEKAGVWEDFIDIFYAPSSVFARRANASVWPPLLVVTLLVGGIFLANSRLIEPIMISEFERAAAAQMRDNPQVTPEMMERGRGFGMMFARVGAFIGTPIAICLLGVVLWGAGKLFDARQSLRQSILISAYSFVPMVLAALAVGIQGLLLDVSGYTSRYQVSLSAARFADPDSTSQLVLNLLGRLDVFTIWVTVLLAIGLSVIGRIPLARAAIAAAIVWVAGSIPGLYEALGR